MNLHRDNLQHDIQGLADELTELVGEDYKEDIENIIHEKIGDIMKEYALLTNTPYGESFYEEN